MANLFKSSFGTTEATAGSSRGQTCARIPRKHQCPAGGGEGATDNLAAGKAAPLAAPSPVARPQRGNLL